MNCRMAGRVCIALLLGLCFAACSWSVPGAGTAQTALATPITCGAVTRLISDRAFGDGAVPGVLAGPLFFGAFVTRTDGVAIVNEFALGYPTKVAIQPMQQFTVPIELKGRNCSNGAQLRFWYREGVPFAHVPVTPKEMGSTGDLVATFQPPGPGSPGRLATYTGYMLFTQPGRWRISVNQNGKELASAVFQVGENS